jgi:hypothetical protein
LSRDGPKFLPDRAARDDDLQSAPCVPARGIGSFVLGLVRHLEYRHPRPHPNGAVLLIMLSVVVLLIGLVSEQISALRFDGRK